jgi:hypothetical protein
MWQRPRQDPRDLAFLGERKIESRLVEVSFFKHPSDWRCPVCDIAKHDLIHQRRNGKWCSGIEEHHYGDVPPGDIVSYMRDNKKVFICYRCNNLEKDLRRQTGSSLMSVEAMRGSNEFMERRKALVVRNTYATPDPKGKWNTDGTRRR